MAFHWIGKSEDGKTVTLNRLEKKHFTFPEYFSPEWEITNSELVRFGAILDVETTGLNQAQDQVIEIGVRQFRFNRESGEVLSMDQEYSAFQDPGFPLSDEVKSITGITDEMVKGKKIDWIKVDSLLQNSSIIIAHNASFDRPFIDLKSEISKKKIWGCSFKQVNWEKYGYTSSKLEVLSIYHGFFNDSHRALSDSDSLLYLLSLKNQLSAKPYLHELIGEARKTTVQVMANYAPFEAKDLLKNRNYRWDAPNKVWSKIVEKETAQDEVLWLEEQVYRGSFKGKQLEILPADQFKAQL